MKKTRLNDLKTSLTIGFIAYRKEIRRFALKLTLIINMALFVLSIVNNNPSMILYLINVHFLYKYMVEQYPEERIKVKDRYEGM